MMMDSHWRLPYFIHEVGNTYDLKTIKRLKQYPTLPKTFWHNISIINEPEPRKFRNMDYRNQRNPVRVSILMEKASTLCTTRSLPASDQ
jgi:hypothetical protein